MLRKVIIADVLLFLLYLSFNWIEYLGLEAFGPNSVTISSHFPFFVETSANVNGNPSTALILNFPLLIFLIAMIVNLRFIIRLQKL